MTKQKEQETLGEKHERRQERGNELNDSLRFHSGGRSHTYPASLLATSDKSGHCHDYAQNYAWPISINTMTDFSPGYITSYD